MVLSIKGSRIKKIMKLHGGEITLQNRFIQKGAEAKLRFPISNN